jgi:hypothetical protein
MLRVPKPTLYEAIFQAWYKAEIKFYELLMLPHSGSVNIPIGRLIDSE